MSSKVVTKQEEEEEKENLVCETNDKTVNPNNKKSLQEESTSTKTDDDDDDDDKQEEEDEMWGSNQKTTSVSMSSSMPDQSDLWKSFPIKDDPWVGTHQALRNEIQDLEEAMKVVASRPLSHKEIDHLQIALTTHIDHCYAHHDLEDKLLKPKLQQRIPQFPSPFIKTEHTKIEAELSKLRPMVKNLKEGDQCDKILSQLQHYESILVPHMKAEEEDVIPLLRKYFTPVEMSPVSRQFFTNGPKEMTGSFIDQMGESAFRSQYMTREGVPFFVWYMGFKPGLTTFLNKFRVHVDALKNQDKTDGNKK